MKTLENQTLLYDEDCPLCSLYTTGFVKAGMLSDNVKKPFSGNSFSFIEKVARIRPINYLLKKLYSFISYNRKVIIPNKRTSKPITCIPDFNYKYRILYITFTVVITTLALFSYSRLISTLSNTNLIRELLLTIGQLIFQNLFLIRSNKKIRLNYIGNLMTVSLMGSLFLIPILFINKLAPLPEIIILVWFGLTVALMFAEHFRRVRILGLPTYLCYTWVLYRIIALALLLNL